LDALKVEGPVQENFRNTKYNEATIEYLENRSLLNNRVAKVNDKMSAANALLIEINDMIMTSNEEIVAFNAAQIETNKKLLEGILPDKATPEANAARIAENKARIDKISERCLKYNREKVDNVLESVKANRTHIEENAQKILERRAEIEKNRAAIAENAQKVAALLRG